MSDTDVTSWLFVASALLLFFTVMFAKAYYECAAQLKKTEKMLAGEKKAFETWRADAIEEYKRAIDQLNAREADLGEAAAIIKDLVERVKAATADSRPMTRDRKFWKTIVQIAHPDKAVNLDVARTALHRITQLAAKELS